MDAEQSMFRGNYEKVIRVHKDAEYGLMRYKSGVESNHRAAICSAYDDIGTERSTLWLGHG